MKSNYLCPHCRGYLNVGENIIFAAKTKSHKRGLVLLSPKIGDYSVITHIDFKFEQGELISFYCPICNISLEATAVNENLANVVMKDETGKEYDVFFSGIAGERCTYKITDKKVEAFGEKSIHYINFFNLSSR
ncbi:MAG: hypothetical protein A2033_05860 [Bacteroidetes bacterium GWA2_31_9]|nr:MAG: hypothetical protein A2033_05860 [Bacteroidetes bacterium GWA2_31_9]